MLKIVYCREFEMLKFTANLGYELDLSLWPISHSKFELIASLTQGLERS